MSECFWPCVATFFVGLVVGAAGMWFYFLLDVLRAHRRGDHG